MTLLVVYESIEGQTQKIALFIAEQARKTGREVRLVNTADKMAAVSFEDTSHVILAAPVHERRHPKAFEVFVGASEPKLKVRKTFMVSVSLKAAFKDGMEDAQDFLTEMKMRTKFEPTEEMLLAGAVRTGSYDYFSSQILQHVVLDGQDSSVGTKDQEFTDWTALSQRVAAFLEG